jgi:hypothetical protein
METENITINEVDESRKHSGPWFNFWFCLADWESLTGEHFQQGTPYRGSKIYTSKEAAEKNAHEWLLEFGYLGYAEYIGAFQEPA